MAEPLWLEDLTVGLRFASGTVAVTAQAIKAFANAYDPQPFHTDEAAAGASFFGGLVASGWHTAALTMRLLVDGTPIAGGLVGAGTDGLGWPRPVRPGDVLRLESEILEVRPSRSRPEVGLARLRILTLNQAGETVQVLVARLVVPRRPAVAERRPS